MQAVLAYAGELRGNAQSWPQTRELLLGQIDSIEEAEDEDEIGFATPEDGPTIESDDVPAEPEEFRIAAA